MSVVAVLAVVAVSVPWQSSAREVSVSSPTSRLTLHEPSSAKAAPPRGRIGRDVRGWRLNARNVGLAPYGLSCDALKPYRGPAKPPAGTRIKKRLVTQPLDLSNGDIIVSKSCIRPSYTGYHNNFLVTTTTCESSCWATGRGHVVIRDSEISGWGMSADQIATSCAFLGVGDLQRNLMHGMGSGICYFETGVEHSALAEQNYVVDLRSYGDSHNEAATVRDFRDEGQNPDRSVVFLNNRLDCSSGNVTAGLFIQPTWDSIYHLDVIGNYLEGEGYNLYLDGSIEGATYGDVRAINNRFRSTGWGPSTVTDGYPGWNVWRENYLFSTARKGARGQAVRP
jgi:hypothetical protein